jgi:hypothetical protein
MEGWSDAKFARFKDEYLTGDRMIKEGLNYFEDVLEPELKRILAVIENY